MTERMIRRTVAPAIPKIIAFFLSFAASLCVASPMSIALSALMTISIMITFTSIANHAGVKRSCHP